MKLCCSDTQVLRLGFNTSKVINIKKKGEMTQTDEEGGETVQNQKKGKFTYTRGKTVKTNGHVNQKRKTLQNKSGH